MKGHLAHFLHCYQHEIIAKHLTHGKFYFEVTFCCSNSRIFFNSLLSALQNLAAFMHSVKSDDYFSRAMKQGYKISKKNDNERRKSSKLKKQPHW